MKKITWRKQHKWLGIGMSFFMLMFCLSGILLNHRSLIKDVDVSRKYLPSRYEFKNWNGGLLRGTLALDDAILLYGNGGIWQTDSTASTFKDFNKGMPAGADCRQIRNVIRTDDGSVWSVSPFSLYRLGSHKYGKRNSSNRAGREVERHFCSWRYAFGSQPLLCLCFLATLSELPPDRIAYAKGV